MLIFMAFGPQEPEPVATQKREGSLRHPIDSPFWLADRCPSMDFLIGSNRRTLKGRLLGQRQSITRCSGRRVFLAGPVLA